MSTPTIVDVAATEIGTFYLSSRTVEGVADQVWEIWIGDDVLMTSLSPVSEMRLATSALEQHEDESGLRVLIGGLGLGYTAIAALGDARVASVRVVEKMDFIMDWFETGHLPTSEKLQRDNRARIVKGDIYQDLLGPPHELYDVILVDVDHAPDDRLSETSAAFYTEKGQERVAAHLRRGGVLGVWSAVEDESFSNVLARVYDESHSEEVAWQDAEFPEADYQNALFFARKAR